MSLNPSAEADSDQSSSSTISDPPEFSLAERLQLALEAHQIQVKHETALVNWILRLQGWGWPARVIQVRDIARVLLDKKNDNEPLGVDWVHKFLDRHPLLKTAFVLPLDKERVMAQDLQIFKDWFTLYASAKSEYSIKDSDIWNMDEKGFMQGVIGKENVVISKHKMKTLMKLMTP